MAPFRSPLFLAAILAAAPAPAQTVAGQLFNPSGSDWLLRMDQASAPLMAGLDGALHPDQLTLLEAPGDTVALPRNGILILWFRDPPQFQAHPVERATFDLVDPAGRTGAVGAYWRLQGVDGASGAQWDATHPNPYGQFHADAFRPYRLMILPPA
jgi:hypothetical protein